MKRNFQKLENPSLEWDPDLGHLKECFNPLCGKEYRGPDQSKYCSTKCKDKVNNQRKKEERDKYNSILRKIIQNEKVLEKFYYKSKGEVALSLQILIENGFKLGVAETDIISQLDSKVWSAYYDYCYRVDKTRTKIKIDLTSKHK